MKLLILALVFVATCASAQVSAPPWLQQIKLSGLSGATGHRLAVINNKTFSTGDAATLKLKGRTIQVQCLEIRDQSVLLQIQDLPGQYQFTLSGDILDADNNPVNTTPPQPVARIQSPPPIQQPPVNLFISAPPVSPPSSSGSNGTIWFLAIIVLALVIGLALGFRAARWQHHKNIGEAMLADNISGLFSRPHLLLNNVTLPMAGGTTQIDHILIADTGIFVIETKHYSGWIFGNPQDKQWTQTIYRKKSRFQNPLHQNYGHVKALQSLFDLPEDHFHSVVVFTADAEFKSDLGPNVVRLANLIPFLSAERSVVFDEHKMAYVVGRIEMKRNRRSVETDEYHINHLRNRHGGQTAKPAMQATMHSISKATTTSGDEKYQPKT